jgi:hypothetical protein
VRASNVDKASSGRRSISQASDSNGAGASIGFSAGLLWSLRFDLDFGGECV